jgi:enamine deaminase RidA (YjgF/YER057c/UK114 family)
MATAHGQVQHINPDGLHRNPAFTHMITVSGPVKVAYVGAQFAVNKDGEIVGRKIWPQTEQIFKNIDACLEAGSKKNT